MIWLRLEERGINGKCLEAIKAAFATLGQAPPRKAGAVPLSEATKRLCTARREACRIWQRERDQCGLLHHQGAQVEVLKVAALQAHERYRDLNGQMRLALRQERNLHMQGLGERQASSYTPAT